MRPIPFLIIALTACMTAKAETIQIRTALELRSSLSNWSNDNTYELTANINLGDETWTPVGSPTNPFATNFDGNGYTITGLKVNASATSSGFVAGLFGVIGSSGCVQDLTVGSTEVRITDSNNYTASSIGAIAGINAGTIIGCANRGVSVFGNVTNAYVGGIAGENSGSITLCYNLGLIYSNSSYSGNYLGGIVGQNDGLVKNCFARNPTESSSNVTQPICGNDISNATSCFYMNGATTDNYVNLSLSDNASNTITVSSDSKNVLLQDRTLYSDAAWNTLCLPFSIPAASDDRSPIAGAEVRELTSASFASGILTLNFSDVTSIEAGKPYLLRWTDAIADNLSNPVFLRATISNATPIETVSFDLGNDMSVQFIGNYSPFSIGSEGNNTLLYLGSGNLLYYPSAAMTINSFRATFRLTNLTCAEKTSQSIRAFNIDFGDEGTGITAIQSVEQDNAGKTNQSGQWYAIDGTTSNSKPTQKGIYIRNGRKVIFW